jgi:hypothetical protein
LGLLGSLGLLSLLAFHLIPSTTYIPSPSSLLSRCWFIDTLKAIHQSCSAAKKRHVDRHLSERLIAASCLAMPCPPCRAMPSSSGGRSCLSVGKGKGVVLPALSSKIGRSSEQGEMARPHGASRCSPVLLHRRAIGEELGLCSSGCRSRALPISQAGRGASLFAFLLSFAPVPGHNVEGGKRGRGSDG